MALFFHNVESTVHVPSVTTVIITFFKATFFYKLINLHTYCILFIKYQLRFDILLYTAIFFIVGTLSFLILH